LDQELSYCFSGNFINSFFMVVSMLSIITPAYNETINIPVLFQRLKTVMEGLATPWEWIIVDDGSDDGTFQTIEKLAAEDEHIRGLRLSRNFGSHNAIMCGLAHAKGEAAVCMACDGQDPPEVIPELVEKWKEGLHVVWAARETDSGTEGGSRFLPRIYYLVMRRLVGIKDMPSDGADFFLVDRKVIEALKKYPERNMSVFALVTWVGFRQGAIRYKRQSRLQGVSGWNLSKKLKLFVDSVISFSYVPIRMMALVGLTMALAGLLYAPVIIINYLVGEPARGWTELMVVILVIGGLQMLMLSMLGEYLWRTLEESRGRPRYLIENATSPNESEQDGPV